MSEDLKPEIIYGAWCAECGWGAGNLSTTEKQAERLVERHNAEEHAHDA